MKKLNILIFQLNLTQHKLICFGRLQSTIFSIVHFTNSNNHFFQIFSFSLIVFNIKHKVAVLETVNVCVPVHPLTDY